MERRNIRINDIINRYGQNGIFCIAEAGTHHFGDIQKAFKLIDTAKQAGCHAIKFQHVIAKEILHPQTGILKLPSGKIDLFKQFQKLEVSIDFFKKIKNYAKKKKILFLCSAYGEQSALELNSIKNPIFKIASPESNEIKLLKTISSYKVPFIISTGVCRLRDIKAVNKYLNSINIENEQYMFMQCVTNYPAEEKYYNLNVLRVLSKQLNINIGLSDHSSDPYFLPIVACILQTLFNNFFILEKHFITSHQKEGLDDAVAISAEELKILIELLLLVRQKTFSRKKNIYSILNLKEEMIEHIIYDIILSVAKEAQHLANSIQIEKISPNRIKIALGDGKKKLSPTERKIYQTTNRSLIAIRNIKQGELISPKNAQYLRSEQKLKPGLNYKYSPVFYNLTSKKMQKKLILAKTNIKNSHPITLKNIRIIAQKP